MNRLLSGLITLLSVVCFLWVLQPKAWGLSGYVDPGTGLLALQCLTSVFAATGFFLRKRITALFGGKKQEKVLTVASGPVSKGETLRGA